MTNGKNVKFRENSCEKSPSPKRFQEPEGMTDIDLRRLSEISGVSDSSLKKFNSKTVKKKLCNLLFIILSIALGSLIILLVLSEKGSHPWSIFKGNKIQNTQEIDDLVKYYENKLVQCKETGNKFGYNLEDNKILDAILKQEIYQGNEEYEDEYPDNILHPDLLKDLIKENFLALQTQMKKNEEIPRDAETDAKIDIFEIPIDLEMRYPKMEHEKVKRDSPPPQIGFHHSQTIQNSQRPLGFYREPLRHHPAPPPPPPLPSPLYSHPPAHLPFSLSSPHHQGHKHYQDVKMPQILQQSNPQTKNPLQENFSFHRENPKSMEPNQFSPPLNNFQPKKEISTTNSPILISIESLEQNLETPGDNDNKMRSNVEPKIGQFISTNEVQSPPRCIPTYTPPVGSPLPLMQQQVPYSYDPSPKFAQLIPLVIPRTQDNSYVINPQYTYITSNIPTFSQIPYSVFSANGQNVPAIQTAGPGGQYYICNPATTTTVASSGNGNNIATMPGVEVRLSSSLNLDQLGRNGSKTRQSEYCPDGQELCADGSKCIHKSDNCDGEVNCDDASDETYCSCKLRVGLHRICDGYYDCPNGEDEIGCFDCSPDTFNCDDWSYSHPSTCIPLHERCDGVPNCPTGKDEDDCSVLLEMLETSKEPMKISLNSGFLHRNHKGRWFPVCSNPEGWALDACKDEAGPSVLPPLTQVIPVKGDYKAAYISALPEGHVEIVDSCISKRAVFVECPQPTCGIRNLFKNPFRPEEVDTSAEEIAARFRPKRQTNSSLIFEGLIGDERVVGGKPCQPAAWPWVVSIYKNGAFHCGGVLISDRWVITAGHCVEKFWQYYYEIESGMLRRFSYSPMQQTRYVSHVIPHTGYDRANLKNDLALMRLNAPVKYNRYVRPICLPSEFTAGRDYLKGPLPGTICTAVGWGATVEHGSDPDHMREVEVPVLPFCKHKEDAEGNEICAGLLEGGKDACQGDSGGPFLCRNPNIHEQWYLAGIVSHGEGCARPNEPGVYTKVAIYRDWIYEHAKDDMLPQRKPLHNCPGFTCKIINKCIPKKRHCDKIVDCLYGDDEIDCENVNPISTLFKHAMRHMILGQKPITTKEIDVQLETATVRNHSTKDDTSFASPISISDHNKFISNKEINTRSLNVTNGTTGKEIFPREVKRFLCEKMLELIPLKKKCDKIIDCQDGTDEESCNCADYLRNSHPEAICDGITDCKDLSDEKDCGSCLNDKHFYCRLSKTCIPLEKKCNNNPDCKYNEDEWDCFALTDKYQMELDVENRPKLNTKGILVLNSNGNWKPMCGNYTNMESTIAADVCVSLGFSDYQKYLQLVVYSGALNTPHNNTNNTCNGLYIQCTDVTIENHKIGNVDRLNAPKELYTSPWNAAIYADGEYKCMGTILNFNWILTSINCFPGILQLSQHYVSVLLGTGRSYLNVSGPHEQIIQIVDSRRIAETDAILLRLRTKFEFTRYVRPLHFQMKNDFVRFKETCAVTGTDRNHTSRTILLKPVQNCNNTSLRCFKRLDALPSECEVTNGTNPWSGCVVCDSGNGFYPAAVFHELRGECGFSRTRELQSVSYIKRDIYQAMNKARFTVDPPICKGFRCNLGKCIGKEKVCDGIPHCRDGSDEDLNFCSDKRRNCHLTNTCVCKSAEMMCGNNSRCIPKFKFCDQINDCGDLSDEPDICNCQNYLRLTDPNKICDGIRNCLDRSDENPEICKCTSGQFRCGRSSYCIPNEMVCDGHRDCPDNEDETQCFKLAPYENNPYVGEVKTMTAGVWHSGCWPEHIPKTELEDLCKTFGFTGLNVSIWNGNKTNTIAKRPIIDTFMYVWIHKNSTSNLKLAMRSGGAPYVTFKDDPKCHKLFIQCDFE